MKNRIILPVAIIILLAGLGGAYYLYAGSNNQELEYQTVAVARGTVSLTVTGTGNIKTGDETGVYVKSTQTIREVLVKVGDTVAAGDVLVRYDIDTEKRELTRKLAEAEINLENANLNLTSITLPAEGNELLQYQNEIVLAKKNIADAENDLKSTDIRISQQTLLLTDYAEAVSRNEQLLANNSISKNQYDASVTAHKNAQEEINNLNVLREIKEQTLAVCREQLDFSEHRLNNSMDKLSSNATMLRYQLQKNMVKLAELEIEQLQEDLSKLTEESVSPVTGNVTDVNVKQGGIASKSSPVVLISDTSEIKAEMEMAEYDAPLLSMGQCAELSTSGLPGKIYRGAITRLAAEAIKKDDASDGDIVLPVEITIADSDEQLRPGYTVDISIITDERQNVLYIPAQSVFMENGTACVYVYLPVEGTAFKTQVQTGLHGDKTVEITDGLEEGVLIVLNPQVLH